MGNQKAHCRQQKNNRTRVLTQNASFAAHTTHTVLVAPRQITTER